MRLTLGRLLLAVGVVAAAGVIAWSFTPRPILVETAKVVTGRFVATVDEDGKTRVRERYVVVAPLGGRTTRIVLKVGDSVTADETITSIWPSPAPLLDPRSRREAEERLGTAEAGRERAKAAVDRANAQFSQAQADLDRARTLFQRGASTAQALERQELAMRVADRDLRAAEFLNHATEHEVEQAKALLARYEQGSTTLTDRWNVTAPVAGTILKVLQESETVVAPGAPLVEIGDPRDLEIVVDVLSTDAIEIQPGAEVIIERWGGPGTLAGRVRRVEPTAFTKISTLGVEEQRVNVIIDVISPQGAWAGLGDGYRVEARITVFGQDNATIVPTGALFRLGAQWQVYVVKDGRAELRRIEVLRQSGSTSAVASGLSAGETVIVYPGDRIAPGTRVQSRLRD
jgi:HlyD family secretion protein